MRLAQFLEYLKDRTGDSLRAVEWYRAGEAELIYLRDDLDLGDVQRRAAEIHGALAGGNSDSDQDMWALGPELATVSVREAAVLVHFPVDDQSGVVVGLEPEVARSLHGFVADCRSNLVDLKTPE